MALVYCFHYHYFKSINGMTCRLFYCATLEWTLDRSLEVIFTTYEVTVLGIPNYWHKPINNQSEYSYWLHTPCNWRQGDRGVFISCLSFHYVFYEGKVHYHIGVGIIESIIDLYANAQHYAMEQISTEITCVQHLAVWKILPGNKRAAQTFFPILIIF